MLSTLHIENIAVIEQAEIAFDAGFNLTGVSRILTRVFGTAQASFQLEYLAVNGKGGIPKFRLLIVKRDFGEVVDVLYP